MSPFLAPDVTALACAVALDLAFGDPVYRGHPVRLIGRTLAGTETWLRRRQADGYGGGIVLFVVLFVTWVGSLSALVLVAGAFGTWAGWMAHVFLVYSLLAFGDLLRHGWHIERAVRADDLSRARVAVAALVGRDTDRLDGAACRRAAIESLSENLTDGFSSALFWYLVTGLPGLVLFKVVSTMDSMVGYRTPQYLRFGWCGARLDDAMNFVPARLTWLLVGCAAACLPACSPMKAWRIGLHQWRLLPGPNSGWSEAATAGAIQRRLVGPIWMHGRLVTDLWVGDPNDPPAGTAEDFVRSILVISGAAALGLITVCAVLISVH